MEVADKMGISIHPAMQHPVESEAAPACIGGMSNPELLRFGMSAKLRYSEAESPDDPRIGALLVQLNLARAEWNRRHPKLPLRDSF
jgi:hypothetical protein